MRSIQEAVRQREAQLQQTLDEALRQKELQLRELQQTIFKAQQLINQLLETDATSGEKDSEQPVGSISAIRDQAKPAFSATMAHAAVTPISASHTTDRMPAKVLP